MSLQLQPELDALAGERCPFVVFSFPFGVKSTGAGLGFTAVAFAGVRPGILLFFIGLLLLDLALLNSALESELSSISSIGVCCALALFLADLVMGPKYPSWASFASEGVGDGEITERFGLAWFFPSEIIEFIKSSEIRDISKSYFRTRKEARVLWGYCTHLSELPESASATITPY